MIVEFDIPKRLYDDLKSWCEANDIEINKYVSLKIRGALTLDKEEKYDETKIQSNEIIPVIPMSQPNPEITFAVEIEKATELEQNEKNVEEVKPNEEENKPKEKKRRTLKTK